MLNRHKMEMPQRLPRRTEAQAKEAKSKLEFMPKSKFFFNIFWNFFQWCHFSQHSFGRWQTSPFDRRCQRCCHNPCNRMRKVRQIVWRNCQGMRRSLFLLWKGSPRNGKNGSRSHRQRLRRRYNWHFIFLVIFFGSRQIDGTFQNFCKCNFNNF